MLTNISEKFIEFQDSLSSILTRLRKGGERWTRKELSELIGVETPVLSKVINRGCYLHDRDAINLAAVLLSDEEFDELATGLDRRKIVERLYRERYRNSKRTNYRSPDKTPKPEQLDFFISGTLRWKSR